MYECHSKYGDVVRYAPNRIIINTATAWKAIYGYGKNSAKSDAYQQVTLIPGVHSTLATIDNHEHGKTRRLLSQCLSDAKIRSKGDELKETALIFAEGLSEQVDRFEDTQSCEEGWSAPKNLAHWADFFAFDVMSRLVFGTSYSLLTLPTDHWIIDGVLGQMRRVSMLMQLPELEDMGLRRFLFADAWEKALRFSAKSREMMKSSTATEKEKNDNMMAVLRAAKDPQTGRELDEPQLWAESNLLIIAGSDTSSTGLAATFFYLTSNPAAYERVSAEVRAAFADPSAVQLGFRLSSCVYLRACIQEALRLAPPISGALWRSARPGGLHIALREGEVLTIPAGLEVGTCIYALNRSADVHGDPMAYRPERWLGREAQRTPFATFSNGTRNCVGKGLAWAEMTLAMAVILSGWDFRRAKDPKLARVGESRPGSIYEHHFLTKSCFTSWKDGPYVEFKKIQGRGTV
ncbi:hypothetical protein PspLS_06297 [Pyricularia sp. CBS 133598]|nr:hypothetical protein PspLS_06297 [Pyricularia sp. CBS 133598]